MFTLRLFPATGRRSYTAVSLHVPVMQILLGD